MDKPTQNDLEEQIRQLESRLEWERNEAKSEFLSLQRKFEELIKVLEFQREELEKERNEARSDNRRLQRELEDLAKTHELERQENRRKEHAEAQKRMRENEEKLKRVREQSLLEKEHQRQHNEFVREQHENLVNKHYRIEQERLEQIGKQHSQIGSLSRQVCELNLKVAVLETELQLKEKVRKMQEEARRNAWSESSVEQEEKTQNHETSKDENELMSSIEDLSELFSYTSIDRQNQEKICEPTGQELKPVENQKTVGGIRSSLNEACFYHRALDMLGDQFRAYGKERYHSVEYQSSDKSDTYAYVLRFFMDVEGEFLQYKTNKSVDILRRAGFQGCKSVTNKGRVLNGKNAHNFYKYIWSDSLTRLKRSVESNWSCTTADDYNKYIVHFVFAAIAFRHANTLLEQSGQWAFQLKEDYKDIYYLHIVDWYFNFLVYLKRTSVYDVANNMDVKTDYYHYKQQISTLMYPLGASQNWE